MTYRRYVPPPIDIEKSLEVPEFGTELRVELAAIGTELVIGVGAGLGLESENKLGLCSLIVTTGAGGKLDALLLDVDVVDVGAVIG